MDDWQKEALKLYNAGMTDYQTLTDHMMLTGHFDIPRKEAYQRIRKFIYKCRLRHPELITANIASDKKIAEEPKAKEEVHQKRNADGTYTSERLIKIIEADLKDDKFLLEAHGFDPDKFDIVNATSNFWSMNSADEERVNCQSKITVKPKAHQELTEASITQLFDKLDRTIQPLKLNYHTENNKYIAVVNLVDFHLGKLCWHGDTREDYDIKIAQKIWAELIGDVHRELCNHIGNIEFVLFNWAHDFFHIDNEQNTTTHGTPQDVDGRLTKIFNIGCELLIQAVDKLTEIAPVKTFWCKSNHDTVHGYHALCFLNAWYRQNKNVEVNTDAYPRKYYEYGNNLIGFSHGADEKKKNLPMLMPLEEPIAWGRTKYRYFELAHLHSEYATEETNGILIERLSSPTASDAWHIDSGYIGSTRKITTHIYDWDKGRKYTIQSIV